MAANDPDWIRKYALSREIYLGDELAILVDGFNYAAHYHRFVKARRAQHVGGATGEAADSASTLPSSAPTLATSTGRSGDRDAQARSQNTDAVRVFYLLSHFHSDHYTGITSTWRHGPIYCSRGTAALVQYRLRVSPHLLCPLEYNVCYHFSLRTGQMLHSHPYRDGDYRGEGTRAPCGVAADTFTVLLVTANHCPAASIFVFRSPAFGVVVHTGDFRFSGTEAAWRAKAAGVQRWLPAGEVAEEARRQLAAGRTEEVAGLQVVPFYEQFVQAHTALRDIAGCVDTLYMDNTFCHPAYSFPSQWLMTQKVIGTLHALLCEAAADAACRHVGSADEVHCAVLLGSYSIGKERMALALQEVLRPTDPQCQRIPIFVHPYKYQLLRCLDYFLERFQPVRLATTTPTLRQASLGFEQEDTDGYDQDNYDPAHFRRQPVRAVEVQRHAVQLPVAVDPSSGATQSAALPKTRFYVSLYLVPLWAVNAPNVMIASRPFLKREREVARQGGATSMPGQPNIKTDVASRSEDSSGCCGDSEGKCASSMTPAQDKDIPLLLIGSGMGVDLTAFDRVLAVAPTGWMKRLECRHIGQRVRLLRVPYSEHSSYNELLDFVQFVNPRHLIPTVSAEQFTRYEPAFLERAPRLRGRRHTTLPLTRFFGPGAELAVASARRQLTARPTTPPTTREEMVACVTNKNEDGAEEGSTKPQSSVRRPIDPFCAAENDLPPRSARRTTPTGAPRARTTGGKRIAPRATAATTITRGGGGCGEVFEPIPTGPWRQATLLDTLKKAQPAARTGKAKSRDAGDVTLVEDSEPVVVMVDVSSDDDDVVGKT